ncbi:MAG: nuclear transport factor 2 family protein [Pleurocapsa sp.]
MGNLPIKKLNVRQKYSSSLIIAGVLIIILFNTLVIQYTVAQPLPMKKQITEMVIRQAKAWSEQNIEAIVNDFAEDAVFIAAGFKFQGKQQIEQAAQNYFQQFHHTSVKIKRIVIEDKQGAVEWDWRDKERQTGKEGYAEDAIIFELENSQIIYWREYIEKKKL